MVNSDTHLISSQGCAHLLDVRVDAIPFSFLSLTRCIGLDCKTNSKYQATPRCHILRSWNGHYIIDNWQVIHTFFTWDNTDLKDRKMLIFSYLFSWAQRIKDPSNETWGGWASPNPFSLLIPFTGVSGMAKTKRVNKELCIPEGRFHTRKKILMGNTQMISGFIYSFW